MLFVPLIIAAILTIRFSSMEVGVVSFGIICLLAFLPVLTSAAIGSFQMWNGNLQEGHWIEVGKYHGEVTGISLFEVSLVPEDGGMVRLPMIYLLMNPVRYRAEVPKFEIRFTVKKMGSLTETLDTVAQLFPEKWNVDVSCQSVNSHEVRIVLRAGKFESKIKSETLRILSDACDEKKIELTSDFVEEISH